MNKKVLFISIAILPFAFAFLLLGLWVFIVFNPKFFLNNAWILDYLSVVCVTLWLSFFAVLLSWVFITLINELIIKERKSNEY